MILLGITILIVIIGILCIIKGNNCGFFDADSWILVGILILVFSGIFLTIEMAILLSKPLDYKSFKIKYDTIKETITSKDDIRDATYTNQIIEINQQIRSCNEFKDSKWVGIFQNEKICELQLLTKSNESEVN